MPRGIHGNSSTSYFEIRTRNAEVSFKMGFLGLLRKSKGIPMDSHASEIQNVIMADSVSKFLEFRTYGSPDGAKKMAALQTVEAGQHINETSCDSPLDEPVRRRDLRANTHA